MLRISRLPLDGELTLKLEGKILAPWLDEVRHACAEAVNGSVRTRLDLTGITFVDAAGVELLRNLAKHGVEIAASSSFVSELLRTEKKS